VNLFKVETEPLEAGQAVNVIGELDQATVPELKRVLAEALKVADGAVFVDLSDCDFIDSTGLSLLVDAERRLSEGGRGFAICCPRAEVRRLLELTGIDEAVGMFDTRDAAVAALAQRSSAA
jgi:anti-sigma B factor antagonist